MSKNPQTVWRAVTRARREAYEDFFGDIQHWPTQKRELGAMMNALKSGRAIDGAMRAEMGKALGLLYFKLQAENFVPAKCRPRTPTARCASIAVRLLVDRYTDKVTDALSAAIPDAARGGFYESVETTFKKIRSGKMKASPVSEAAVKVAAQRLPTKKRGSK